MNKFSPYLKQKKKLLKELVARLSEAYDFASVLATDVYSKNYMVDKKISSISPSNISEAGFVVRVYKDHKYYEYSFNEIKTNLIDGIISEIAKMVNENQGIEDLKATMITEEKLTKKFKRPTKGALYSDEEILAKLEEVVKIGAEYDEAVINARASIEFAEFSKMYLSKDRDLEQFYTWINPRTFVLVGKDDNVKYAYDGFGTNDTDYAFSHLKESMTEVAKLALELCSATMPTPGKYTIITDPSITGLIAHEAFGHGTEMDQFVKDRAMGAEFVGKRVASKHVTMHDGAKACVSSASYFFDDEGTLAQDTVIIRKGILEKGICDAVSASILGVKPTGNGRRESYKHKAYTRMTNTFFDKKDKTLEEMIASVEYGYYIAITNNGMEDPKNWGIQCTALYGREIVNGKFSGKIVSPVVMSGYVIDLLESISMVAKDTFDIIGSGSCGKGYKEWVRVSDGGASIKAEVKIG